jgi:hypothetical protein
MPQQARIRILPTFQLTTTQTSADRRLHLGPSPGQGPVTATGGSGPGALTVLT